MRKNVLKLASANMVSKPFGLIRQVAFSTFYGVSGVMSACRFGQTMTLVFMNFFTTDTLNAGFLPLFERYKQTSQEVAQCFFWYLFTLLILLSSAVFLILYAGAPWIVSWFAPGFHSTVAIEAQQFIRVFSLSVPFCLLGTLFSYLAMSGGSCFGVGARPLFESIGLTIGVFISVWSRQVLAIAWAFVIAYVLFFLMVLAICFLKGQLRLVSMQALKANMRLLQRDFWKTVRPLLVVPLFMQGKFVVEKMVASLMAVSIVAALDYARFIVETGINILATPVGLLGLSVFSVLDGKKLAEKIESLVIILLTVAVPITLFLIINSKLIVAVIYGYGAFDNDAINQASTILTGMSIAFFAQVIGYVLIKILSAQLQTKRVMMYFIFALSCNILFIVAFFRLLGPICLGIGESIYAFLIFALCARYFNLGQLIKRMVFFLAPTGLMYVSGAIYLANSLMLARWPAFINQLGWFAVYWAIVLLSYRKTRVLLLGRA